MSVCVIVIIRESRKEGEGKRREGERKGGRERERKKDHFM